MTLKPPKYPLEQLVIIKQKKLDEAEKVLQEKKRALEKELDKLHALEKERNTVKEHKQAKLTQLRQTLDEGSTTDKIQQMKQYLKVVDEELKQKESKVKEQKKQVDAAEKQVEAARADLLKKQQDIEKLAMHRKEWDKEVYALMEHQEAIETDEIGSAMHVLRQKDEHSLRHHHTKKK
ncbi:MAG: type III secretion T3S chaperone [Anaerolineae bacterium]